MSIITIFKSHLPSVSFFFKNGKQAAFINGKYVTEIETEIDELRAEIGNYDTTKSNHPHLYVDPAEKEIDTEAPSAIDIIRQEAYEQAKKDILAEQARAMSASGNVSTGESGSIAASLNNTAKLDGLDGTNPTPVATASVSTVAASLQDKLAALKQPDTTGTSTSAGVSTDTTVTTDTQTN